MIERFDGESGKRNLLCAMNEQVIVHGNEAVAGQLVAVSQLQELDAGDVLIAQDGEDNHISFIISGSVEIRVNRRVVAVRAAGTHVGEMALIDKKARRCADVVASEKTVLARVEEGDFSRIADDNPFLWRRIAVELCDRLRNRNRMVRWPNERPHVFICSSSENLAVAEAIRLGLEHHNSSVSVWTDQVFGPMKHTMEDLEREVQSTDVAIAVVGTEDVVRSRKKQMAAPRDNVIFELGLFMGQLGRERAIIVMPRGAKLKLPSDLLGLNPLSYSPPSDPTDARQLAVSLGPVCTQLKTAITQLGPR